MVSCVLLCAFCELTDIKWFLIRYGSCVLLCAFCELTDIKWFLIRYGFLCAFCAFLWLQTGLAYDLQELFCAFGYGCGWCFVFDEIGAATESGCTGFDEVGGRF